MLKRITLIDKRTGRAQTTWGSADIDGHSIRLSEWGSFTDRIYSLADYDVELVDVGEIILGVLLVAGFFLCAVVNGCGKR